MSRRLAVVQMTSSKDVDTNLSFLSDLMSDISQHKPDVVFLPENFAALGSNKIREQGEREQNKEGYIRSSVAQMAREGGFWVVAGSIPTVELPGGKGLVSNQRVRAACLVYDDKGREVGRYDKIHMFDVDVDDSQKHYRESEKFEPGDHVAVIDTPAGRLGLSICYDIRFPELYRLLFSYGAEIFSIPSAFTRVTGKAHFSLLMRARAVENLCYTVASCQAGYHDSGRETWGHSMVVSPWGEILGKLVDEEGYFCVDIDMDALRDVRSRIPIGSQRKKVENMPVKVFE